MFFRSAAAVTALVALVNAEHGHSPNYFITFGNSYSQTGFNISGEKPSAANPLGNPSLPGETASGGLNWVGFMVTEFNATETLSYNFAYGGATVNASLVAPFEDTVLSLIDQVQEFSDSIASKPDYAPWNSHNAVVGLWLGVNDVGNSYFNSNASDVYKAVASDYFEQLQILYDAGIRQFIILSVPPIGKTPLLISEGTTAVDQVTTAISEFNGLIADGLHSFTSTNHGIRAKIVDTSKAFNKAINDPTAYGAPNATCYDADGTTCLWFNDYHPGIAIEKLVASEVAAEWGSGFFVSRS